MNWTSVWNSAISSFSCKIWCFINDLELEEDLLECLLDFLLDAILPEAIDLIDSTVTSLSIFASLIQLWIICFLFTFINYKTSVSSLSTMMVDTQSCYYWFTFPPFNFFNILVGIFIQVDATFWFCSHSGIWFFFLKDAHLWFETPPVPKHS